MRIPFRSHLLYGYDSVNFALGMERFNVPRDRPHPPGYILYIGLGRLFNLFFGNANTALVTLSILSGALAVVAIFLVGRSIFNYATGITAAVMLLFSPLLWFSSEVALSHAIELPLALLATWLLYQVFFHRRYALLCAVVIGIAGGIRQDVLLFLGPVWFIGTARLGLRTLTISAAALLASVLAWTVPLIYSSGGLSTYRTAASAHFADAIYPVSVFAGGVAAAVSNLWLILLSGFWLLGAATPLVLLTVGVIAIRPRRLLSDRRIIFLLLLPLPALAFFILVNFSHPAYSFVYAGSLVLIVARVLTLLAAGGPEGICAMSPLPRPGLMTARLGPVILAVFLAVVAVINTGLYFRVNRLDWGIPHTGETLASVYNEFDNNYIVTNDNRVGLAAATIRHFDPEKTLIVIDGGVSSWRSLSYYVPDYMIVVLRGGEGYRRTQSEVQQLVLGTVTISVPAHFRQALVIDAGAPVPGVKLTPVPGDYGPLGFYTAKLPAAGDVSLDGYDLTESGAGA